MQAVSIEADRLTGGDNSPGLVESFPAGQGSPRREEKNDSCSGGDNRAITPYSLQYVSLPMPPRWSSAWSLLSEQPIMFTNGCRLVSRAKAGLTWTSGS